MTWAQFYFHFRDELDGVNFPHSELLSRPGEIRAARDLIRRARETLSDERSMREFDAQIKWRVTADPSVMPEHDPPTPDMYWPRDLIQFREYEIFVDCGAYTGDTIAAFCATAQRWQRIVAFEPDPVNYARIDKTIANLIAL